MGIDIIMDSVRRKRRAEATSGSSSSRAFKRQRSDIGLGDLSLTDDAVSASVSSKSREKDANSLLRQLHLERRSRSAARNGEAKSRSQPHDGTSGGYRPNAKPKPSSSGSFNFSFPYRLVEKGGKEDERSSQFLGRTAALGRCANINYSNATPRQPRHHSDKPPQQGRKEVIVIDDDDDMDL